MEKQILFLIEGILGVSEGTITLDTKIEDIEEWDSLSHVMIIGELSEKFGIDLDLDKAVEVKTARELIELAGIN